MHRHAILAAAGLLALAPATTATANTDGSRGIDHAGSVTMAIYGDAPYGTSPTDTAQFTATPAFIDSINADPDVRSIVHVGDIHSGKQYCTRSYDESIAALWTRFADPLVYTPGDNEWTDCHKKAEGGGSYDPATGQITYVTDPGTGAPVDYAAGNPLANLQLIRSIFFAHPGHTLGGGQLRVLSQAQLPDPAHPGDQQYVENVMWLTHGTQFVTINVPGGSNNDADPWYGTPTQTPPQSAEAAARTSADLRWLDLAFTIAHYTRVGSVAVAEQADLWDLDGNTPAHLTNYEPIVSSLATHTTQFARPVLLLEGDSHIYRSDNPLQQGAPCTGDQDVCAYDDWNSHPFYAVPNLHRIVVHGSTFPLEWLKLTITPDTQHATTPTTFGPFSWQRMPQN